MTDADRMWAAAAELGQMIAEKRAADRKATKDARNTRRRTRYAATKHLRAAKTAEPVSTAEEDWEPFCTCHRSAPCHYCTEIREEDA